MKWDRLLLLPIFLCLTITCYADATPFNQRAEVKTFINQMVTQYHFNRAQLNQAFSKIHSDPRVLQLMEKPYEKKPWYIYRQHFISPVRASEGKKFWLKNKSALIRAEKKYGVPASIIVAIVGVESNYGAQEGTFPVMQTLATLAFDYPKRSAFFKSELQHFLIFTREEHLDPLKPKGSYAGAMGQPQFMPSSYRNYAVDFSGNGRRDLITNSHDVIGSVANYLNKNGWKRNEPIATKATITGHSYQQLSVNTRTPAYTVAQLIQYGITPDKKTTRDQKAIFISLQDQNKDEYWLGFHNFYVITRYNTSILYAMAVFQLSQAIQTAVSK